MNFWFDAWHSLTPAQGTILGGVFVLLAGIVAFGTGALNRRSEAKRFHYEEMKALYSQALRIGRDLGASQGASSTRSQLDTHRKSRCDAASDQRASPYR